MGAEHERGDLLEDLMEHLVENGIVVDPLLLDLNLEANQDSPERLASPA